MNPGALYREVGELQAASRPSPKWTWGFARRSTAHILALYGLTLDATPYRSPHSTAGNISWCSGIPAESCVAGGWVLDGKCLRDECDVPAGVEQVAGICALRQIGNPALSPQVSRDQPAPDLPRHTTHTERCVRDWLRRLIPCALATGDESVIRGALAYRGTASCSLADTVAFGDWAHTTTLTLMPWTIYPASLKSLWDADTAMHYRRDYAEEDRT